jgi:hypothetical protein
MQAKCESAVGRRGRACSPAPSSAFCGPVLAAQRAVEALPSRAAGFKSRRPRAQFDDVIVGRLVEEAVERLALLVAG